MVGEGGGGGVALDEEGVRGVCQVEGLMGGRQAGRQGRSDLGTGSVKRGGGFMGCMREAGPTGHIVLGLVGQTCCNPALSAGHVLRASLRHESA
jgi:hypothetical protein